MKNTNTKPTPTEVDWARLAMCIDTEGCIDIHTHRQFMPHLRRIFTNHRLRVTVVNTDPRLATWLKETFGGTTAFRPRRNAKWRHVMDWVVNCAQAAELLIGCRPYMVMKQEQVDIALAFQKTITRKNGRRGMGTETFEQRLRLQQELKDSKWARRISDSGENLTVQ